jgi:hypothetical protein
LCTLALAASDRRDQTGAWQAGWDHGYRKGIDRGTADRPHKYHLKSSDFKKAESGYDKRFGKKDDYKQGFREGYRMGYDEGYHGRPARAEAGAAEADRSNDAAYDAGYRAGLRAGDEDFRRSRQFRPEQHEDYRNADRGHTPDYGDKKLYENRYREGFLQGYRDGYHGRQ